MSKKDKDLEQVEEPAKKETPKASKEPSKSVKQDNKKADKNKKPNIFVRMGRKIKETFSELKRVTWPTFPQALKATGVVIVIVLIFTVLVTGVNKGFSELLGLLTGLGG